MGCSFMHKCENQGGDKNISKGNWEEAKPAKSHELVIAETRKCPANPDKENEQCGDLGEEDSDINFGDGGAHRVLSLPHLGYLLTTEIRPAADGRRNCGRGFCDRNGFGSF